jgi:DnaJ-class molecular chaperone
MAQLLSVMSAAALLGFDSHRASTLDKESIRAAYKARALETHPDKQREASSAEAFNAVRESYQVLMGAAAEGKLKERAIVERFFEETRGIMAKPAPPTKRKASEMVAEEEGRQDRPPAASAPPEKQASLAKRRRLDPVVQKVSATLEQLFTGCTKTVKLMGGPGAAERVIEVKIAPGYRRGTTMIFEGRARDLCIVVEEKPHPLFTRVGDDLHVRAQPGSTSTSVARIEGGEPVLVHADMDKSPTTTIKGLGMPKMTDSKTRGDLVVHFA